MSYVKACELFDLRERPLRVEFDDIDIAVVRQGQDVFAIEDRCSHEDVELSMGEVDGYEIECYAHGSRFDLRTGHPDVPPAVRPIRVFPCRIDGDHVLVDLDNPLNDQEF